ncbi:hypothetical protein G6F38_013451 [Rhizopus arrhizus]|nr:hypothetical protein G6F38_013451 [Rhizopus arrhizus]
MGFLESPNSTLTQASNPFHFPNRLTLLNPGRENYETLGQFCGSLYINTLPAALRDVRLPVSARYYSSMPQREFGGLWINCLLYADDVVLIAAPEVMPKLLMRAEDHSRSLGYRWNPAKCVVLNCPSDHGGRRMKLYGSPIPKEPSFCYR